MIYIWEPSFTLFFERVGSACPGRTPYLRTINKNILIDHAWCLALHSLGPRSRLYHLFGTIKSSPYFTATSNITLHYTLTTHLASHSVSPAFTFSLQTHA